VPVAEKPIEDKASVKQEKTFLELFVEEMKKKAAQGGLRQDWVVWPQSN
jgi:hypothetical protein